MSKRLLFSILLALVLGAVGLLAAVHWIPKAAAAAKFRAERARYLEAGGVVGILPLAPVPGPGANSAALYDEAFALLFPEGSERAPLGSLLDGRTPADLTEEDWKAIQSIVEAATPGIGKLLEAVRIQRCCRFLEYDRGWEMKMPHAPALLAASKVLAFDVRLRLRKGNPEGAWERVDAILAAGMSLIEEPLLVSQLLRIVILELGLEVAEELLARGPPPGDMEQAWMLRLDPVRMEKGIRTGFLGDFGFLVDKRDRYLEGRPVCAGAMPEISWINRKAALPKLYDGAARGLERLTRALRALKSRPLDRIGELGRLNGEVSGDPMSFAHLVPDLPRPWRHQARFDVRWALARAAFVVSREHSPRAGESDMVDPLYGRPLRIESGEGEFTIRLETDEARVREDWGFEAVPAWKVKARSK